MINPIAKIAIPIFMEIEIAVAISIVILKKIGDLDRERGMTIADLFGDLFTSKFGLIFFQFYLILA